jgi:hypothetical protein
MRRISLPSIGLARLEEKLGRSLAVLIILWLTLGWRPCHAETSEASALLKVLYAKSVSDTTNDPRWRAALAVALHRYCEGLLIQVPRNTPQEDRWVDEEFQELEDLASAPSDRRTDWRTFEERAQKWELRWNRVMSSAENARKSLRKMFSDCSSIAKNLMESKQASPAAEALLWVRLSRLFSAEDELWRLADIVGLVSRNGCRNLQINTMDFLKGGATDVRDENKLCHSGSIERVIIDHAVVPLLEAQ